MRFAAVSAASYGFLSLWVLLFGGNAALAIPLVICGLVLLASGYRRLRDAQQPSWWTVGQLLPLFCYGLVLFYLPSTLAISLCLSMALVFTLGLAWFKAKDEVDYVQGYFGPALAHREVPVTQSRRVEPVLDGKPPARTREASALDTPTSSSANLSSHFATAPNLTAETFASENRAAKNMAADRHVAFESQDDDVEFADLDARGSNRTTRTSSWDDDDGIDQSGSLTAMFGRWLAWAKRYQKPLLVTVAVAGVAAIVISLTLMIRSAIDSETESQVQVDKQTTPALNRQTVAMPDGFDLTLENDTLLMSWLGDSGEAQTLWTLATAKGDPRCAQLAFNTGSEYRPMQVVRLANTRTEATFTPLDTQAILKDMALRSSVGLCGYRFSLKGSQAALAKNSAFRVMVE